VPQGEGLWAVGHWGEEQWGEGHREVGHQGQGHWGDCHHLLIQSAAAIPHRRCFRLPQCLAESAPLGEVFAASQAPNAPAD